MALTIQQYAQALHLALQEVGPKDHTKVLDNFVSILQSSGDIRKYESIIAEYEKLDAEAKGIKHAEVTFARDLEVNRHIIEELNGIVGAKVAIEKKVDESIIGGVVVRVEDTLIDASVKGQLESLKDTLSK